MGFEPGVSEFKMLLAINETNYSMYVFRLKLL